MHAVRSWEQRRFDGICRRIEGPSEMPCVQGSVGQTFIVFRSVTDCCGRFGAVDESWVVRGTRALLGLLCAVTSFSNLGSFSEGKQWAPI